MDCWMDVLSELGRCAEYNSAIRQSATLRYDKTMQAAYTQQLTKLLCKILFKMLRQISEIRTACSKPLVPPYWWREQEKHSGCDTSFDRPASRIPDLAEAATKPYVQRQKS